MSTAQIIEAELTYTGERFERGVQVEVGDDGRIVRVGALAATPTCILAGRALLPGFVNAHSHAFQRGLRGLGETFASGRGSFWSWRQAMYDLVGAMDAERMYTLSRQAFEEMRAAGITSVGEFHYLHHDESEGGFAFDDIILRAARDVGLRLVLLLACYRTGDIDTELVGGQRRFAVPSLDAYWTQFDRLATQLDPRTQSLGVVAHSIRAMPIDEIAALHEQSERRGVVFHMHVEEQPLEIERCVAHYHKTPMALLNERLAISPRFTAVHCTHTAIDDMDGFLDRGGGVCLCPLTEANLGDGLAAVGHILRRGGSISLGSDSNARISMIEEMRWLEYGQRLRHQQRGVCVDRDGRIGPLLLDIATQGGARALGLRAGSIAPGRLADFCTVDLGAADLAGATDETLLDALVCGTGNNVVKETCVGGVWSA